MKRLTVVISSLAWLLAACTMTASMTPQIPYETPKAMPAFGNTATPNGTDIANNQILAVKTIYPSSTPLVVGKEIDLSPTLKDYDKYLVIVSRADGTIEEIKVGPAKHDLFETQLPDDILAMLNLGPGDKIIRWYDIVIREAHNNHPTASFTPLPSQTLTQTLSASPTLTSTPVTEHNLLLERTAQLGGSINGITIVGNVAYVGMGPRVAVFDISQHNNPQLIGQSQPLPGLVTQLLTASIASSKRLIVNAGKYLVGMDISNINAPVPLSQLELPGAVTAMVLDKVNDMLYVAGSIYKVPFEYSGYIAALDVSPQDGPSLVDSIDFPEQPVSLALGKGFLYAGTNSYTGGLYLIQFDSSGILYVPRLVIASSTDSYFAPDTMQVIGDRLYAGVSMDFQVYDITHPDQPVQVWKEFVGFMPEGFSLYGQQIDIFGWGAAGTYIPGFATLTTSEPISGSQTGAVASITAAYHDTFLVAFHDLEISSATDLELLGSYQPPVISVLGVAADDRTVYVVDGGVFDGRDNAILRLYSLPDLEPLGQVATEIPSSCCWFSGIAVEGDRAYLATTDGLWVYDLNSLVPTLLQKLDIFSGSLYSIAAVRFNNHRLLFLAQEAADISSMTAYDLTDLEKPIKMGNPLRLDHGRIYRMVWNNASLYAVSTATREGDSDLLYSIEFKNGALELQASLELPGSIFSMAVDDGTVALAGTQGLSIVSEAVPTSPRLLSQVALPEPGRWVAILRDQVVVVSGGDFGAAQLLLFDVADPANPRQTNARDIAFSSGFLWSNPVSEPYIVLTGSSSGLDLFTYTLPSPTLHTCLDRQAVPLALPPRQEGQDTIVP